MCRPVRLALSDSGLSPDRIRCYLFDRPGDAALRVWLQRVTATRVRGGPIQVLRHSPSDDAARISRLVAGFADGCVLPAASAAGARCTRPAFGPRSAVSPAAEILFARFTDTADGEWPLIDRAQALWDDLVSCCLAEQVAIDRAELGRWLADSGWEQQAVTALGDRFFADSESLLVQPIKVEMSAEYPTCVFKRSDAGDGNRNADRKRTSVVRASPEIVSRER